MKEDPENGKESSHSAHTNGMNEHSTVPWLYRMVEHIKSKTDYK